MKHLIMFMQGMWAYCCRVGASFWDFGRALAGFKPERAHLAEQLVVRTAQLKIAEREARHVESLREQGVTLTLGIQDLAAKNIQLAAQVAAWKAKFSASIAVEVAKMEAEIRRIGAAHERTTLAFKTSAIAARHEAEKYAGQLKEAQAEARRNEVALATRYRRRLDDATVRITLLEQALSTSSPGMAAASAPPPPTPVGFGQERTYEEVYPREMVEPDPTMDMTPDDPRPLAPVIPISKPDTSLSESELELAQHLGAT